MSAISDLAEDRVVEGVFAVKAKRRLRTKGGAPYLALELVDPSGRIEARVWNDVELLDARFGEGDAVRVLGRVERFRDRLQLDVRTLEARRRRPGEPRRPRCAATPTSWRASSSSSPARSRIPACAATVQRGARASATSPRSRRRPTDHHSYAGGLLEHTVGVATLCRETAQLHPRLRGDLLLAAALVHDSAGRSSSRAGRRSRRPRRAACSATSTSACG